MDNRLLIFTLNNVKFALEMDFVKELTRHIEKGEVVAGNEYITGMAQIRDDLYMVLNLSKILGIEEAERRTYIACGYKDALLLLPVDTIEGMVYRSDLGYTWKPNDLLNTKLVKEVVTLNCNIVQVLDFEEMLKIATN